MKALAIVTLSTIAVMAESFAVPPLGTTRTWTTTSQRPTVQQKMGGPQDSGAVKRPTNEFSRTVPPDKVLKLHGKHQRTSSLNPMQQRQYEVEIDATSDECKALADRFQLPSIEAIEASLQLSPEGSSGVANTRGILVEGTIHTTLTRTCVRTNEDFQEDMEFPIYSIVRPVTGVGPISPASAERDASVVQLSRSTSKENKKRRRKKEQSAYDVEDDDIDPAEMLKMQTMMNDLEQADENYEDVLMEDEAIFATNGMLDVGELVAQLVWLNLDPYPKKPGASPDGLQFTITG